MEPLTATISLRELWLSGKARLLVCGQEVCPSQIPHTRTSEEENKNAGPFNR